MKMRSTTMLASGSVAVFVVGMLISCYQTEVATSAFLSGMLLKLIVPHYFPTLDNQAASLESLRGMINSQSTEPRANRTSFDVAITTSAQLSMAVRLYIAGETINTPLTSLRPILIWFHGGGFVVGNYTNDDTICSKIVEYTDFIVVSVDYRLAPENKFPAGVNDAWDALRWTKHSIHKYGGDPSRIYISGESAGGNIATSVVALNLDKDRTPLDNRLEIKGLIIFSPCLDHGVYLDSHFRYSDTFALLTLRQMTYFWSLYLPDQVRDAADYRACPMRTPGHILRQFPPTTILMAKYDILLDEGLKFGALLKSLDVPVQTVVYNDSYHAFFTRGFSPEKRTIEICSLMQAMIV
jgi:acetyl esterase